MGGADDAAAGGRGTAADRADGGGVLVAAAAQPLPAEVPAAEAADRAESQATDSDGAETAAAAEEEAGPADCVGDAGADSAVTNATPTLRQIVTETIVINPDMTLVELPAYSDADDTVLKGSRPAVTAVVLLFGWTGSTLRHVSKYRQLYHELSPLHRTAVISHVASYAAGTASPAGLEAFFRPLIDLLLAHYPSVFDLSLPDPPQRPHLIVHAFSNGGSHQLHHFFRCLRLRFPSPARHLPLTSLIVDSAPGRNTVRGFAEFLLVVLRLRRTALSVAACHALSFVVQSAALFVRTAWALLLGRKRDGHKWGVPDDFSEQIFETYGCGPPRRVPGLGGSEWTQRCGKLLIYSEIDQLIDHRGVHEVADTLRIRAAEREARGEADAHGWVEEMKFLDTDHVAHYLAYPDAYRDRLRSFLQRCGVECIGTFGDGGAAARRAAKEAASRAERG